jgi:hypothetical protein
VRTYVIEPQQIFVPSLLQLLQKTGLAIVRVRNTLDPPDVLGVQPQLLFCDDDTAGVETMRALRFLLDAMPQLSVCLSSRSTSRDLHLNEAPQARLLHLEKSASYDVLASTIGRFVTAQ